MKKIIALTLCVLMIVSCFVGCGKQEASGPDLVVWTAYEVGTPTYDVAEEAINAFREKTGANIEVKHYGRDLSTLLGTALDAGERVDVFCVGSNLALRAEFDHTLDLTKYVTESDVLDRAYPICMDIIKGESANDDEYHAIPTISSFNAFWYNAAAFEKAGIEKNPETIEEFEAVCDALVAAGYAPISLDAAYATATFGALVERMVGTEDGTALAKNGGFSKNEKFVEACQKIIEWRNKGYFDPTAPGEWPASQNKIGLTEECVMVYTGMWASGEIEKMTGADLEWGSFKFPYDPEGNGTYGIPVSSTCHCINVDCEDPDLAWEYVYYMNTGEVNKAITDADVYLVDDRTQEPLPQFADTKVIMENTTEVTHYAGGLTENADIKTVMADVIVQLFSGAFATGEEAAAAFDALFV
ncbi:MAG: carbohydrate ABC transporter substrate-binding protein [Oscillospiraceae bacterium]|nr:carbohydrate ABC transporter substrate-binding protein [Oscillospiraceae bacterium]